MKPNVRCHTCGKEFYVCPNCHREIHLGMYSLEKLKNITRNFGRHPAG